MNPYHFSNPEVRAIAYQLAKALADFDTKATAALQSAEQRIAALETTGGLHEVDRSNISDFRRVPSPQQEPTAPAPQDVFRAEADYSHGLSGRLG